MQHLYRLLKLSLCFILVAAFAGCGGGGGANPSTPSGPGNTGITLSNATEVAAKAMQGQTIPDSASSATVGGSLLSIPKLAGSQVLKSISGTQLAPIFNCDTGSVTEPVNGSLSGTITFTNCAMGGYVLNGEIGFSGSVTLSGYAISTTYTNLTYSSGGSVLATFNGDQTYAFAVATNTFTVSGTSFTVQTSSDTATMTNYSFGSSVDLSGNRTLTIEYTVSSSLFGGQVIVTTNSLEGGLPFVTAAGDPYPHTGSLVVIGANNTRVRASANGDGTATGTVTIETDLTTGALATPGGDGIYESINTTTWSEFDLLGVFTVF